MKKVLAVFLMLFPSLAFAQSGHQSGQVAAGNLTYKYDVTGATTTYCATWGQDESVFGNFYPGPGRVETTGGAQTTVTGVDAAQDVFLDVGVGDLVQFQFRNGNVEHRVVVTNADNDTITVDTAIDLDVATGVNWGYKNLDCGTAATDGWAGVSGFSVVSMTMQYDAGDMTDLDVVWECKEGGIGAEPVQVYPGPASDCGFGTLATDVCQFAAAGDRLSVVITDNVFGFCRVGLAVTTDGGTRDEVTVIISGAR
ncbi:MAG: hypothetical protein GTO63_15720 [Anaerolineae bacterium]|nr:hypothetical protein [Anaerolineae bacterium]NIN96277.1 hypothetical protein [Anaerolineae bacterium]NIQ79297.1 hypothetical protein [Anaerolineae bacterium]